MVGIYWTDVEEWFLEWFNGGIIWQSKKKQEISLRNIFDCISIMEFVFIYITVCYTDSSDFEIYNIRTMKTVQARIFKPILKSLPWYT